MGFFGLGIRSNVSPVKGIGKESRFEGSAAVNYVKIINHASM
jgi:hypothetical protein